MLAALLQTLALRKEVWEESREVGVVKLELISETCKSLYYYLLFFSFVQVSLRTFWHLLTPYPFRCKLNSICSIKTNDSLLKRRLLGSKKICWIAILSLSFQHYSQWLEMGENIVTVVVGLVVGRPFFHPHNWPIKVACQECSCSEAIFEAFENFHPFGNANLERSCFWPCSNRCSVTSPWYNNIVKMAS